MKLLVITEHMTARPANGSDVFCREIIERLQRSCTVDVLARKHGAEEAAVRYPVDEATYATPEALQAWLENIDPGAYDLIYNLGALSFGCCIVNYLKHRLDRVPLVNHFQLLYAPYTERSGLPGSYRELFGNNQAEVAGLAAVNIFASTEELLLAGENHFVLKAGRAVVIPNGIAINDNEEDRMPVPEIRQNGHAQPLARFLLAGRLNDRSKGADIAFRAFKRLLQDYGNVKLEIVGNADDYLHLLQEVPPECYRVLPWMSRKAFHRVMQAADVVLVPSRYEPFGLVAAEAQYLGKPVIASDTGGLSEIVVHQLTGLLNPPENGSLGLYQSMKYLTERPGIRREMGRQGRERVIRNYNIDHVFSLIEGQLKRARPAVEVMNYYAAL